MRNKFPGVCYRCGKWCEAGDGHFERLGQSWRVQHASCAIEHRGVMDAERQAHQEFRLKVNAMLTGKKGQRARQKLAQRNAENRVCLVDLRPQQSTENAGEKP